MRRRFVLALSLAVLIAATSEAQPGPRLRQQGPALGAEGLLRMRERLGLTEEQLARLRALRDERLGEQRTRLNQMLELRSKFRSGDLSTEEFRRAQREAMQGVRERQRAAAEQLRGVLTEEQRNRLMEARQDFRRQSFRREMVRREMMRREFRRDRLRDGFRRERFRDELRGDLRLRRERIRDLMRERDFDN